MLFNSDSEAEHRDTGRLPTLRDAIVPVFRHSRGGLLVAVAVLAVTALAVTLAPRKYEADMTVLVKRERAETIVSTDPTASNQRPAEVTEAELNSEVEIIKSRDMLTQVALVSGLASRGDASATGGAPATSPVALARVVQKLDASLDVTPIRKTTLIRMSYRSTDPVLAAGVLEHLGRLYLEKHLALHRPVGAYQFFSEQTDRFRNELREAEDKLQAYGREHQVVSADVERESTLLRLAEFEASVEQTQAQIADANRRLAQLRSTAAGTPSRLATAIKISDNPQLMASLKSTILELELKRAEMQVRFVPTYPPLVELDEKLARARASLASAEQAPATETVTDANPTYQWVQNELARVEADRAAALARASAMSRSVELYRDKARELDEKSAVQQELQRAVKTAEENYQIYLKKAEEARISDALDRTRIANVVIAEPPTVPALPSTAGRSRILVLGFLAALFFGIASTYVLHYLSPYFYTPDDVEDALNIPVLATLSAPR
jgi:uncharacterized protein involved in exopolysaccharide biosynthesis